MNKQKRAHTTLLLLVLCTLFNSHGLSQETDSTKVVCFGDSITKRGYPAELSTLLDIEVIAAGVAGHTSSEGLERMGKDVLSQNPSHVIIFFGTNDLRIDAPHKYHTIEQYTTNIRIMIEKCLEIDAQVVLCTPPPINTEVYFNRHDTAEFGGAKGLNKRLKATRKAVLALGREFKLPVADLNKELKKHPEWMHRDGVHPSPKGNGIIAKIVSKKLEPTLQR